MKFRPSAERNRLWLTFVAVVVFAGSLVAQPTAGRLRGLVTDPSGAVIPGASVSVKNASGLAIAVKSDGAGNYDVKNLTPGKYTVSVVAKGFRAAAEEVEVSAGQDKKQDFPLEILAQEEKVEVESEAAKVSVNPDSNASTMIITGKDLDALSDDPDELQSELQALAGPSAGPNGGQIYIDGFTGGQLPPKSSIREIRINQNPFSAEYDKLGYGRIEIFTKPGTDQYHGQISVLGNSSYFNSTSPFATSNPSYDTTQYTANFGGPVGKKASFFVNFERRDIGDNAIVNAFVIDPTTFVETPYNASVPIPQERTVVSPRMDFQLTPNNTLSVRYQYWLNDQTNQGVGQFSLPSQAYGVNHTQQTLQLSDTQLFGPKVVNEARFEYQRDRDNMTPAAADVTLNVQGAFVGGGNTQQFNLAKQDYYEAQNYTSVLEGKHMIKFGGRLRAL